MARSKDSLIQTPADIYKAICLKEITQQTFGQAVGVLSQDWKNIPVGESDRLADLLVGYAILNNTIQTPDEALATGLSGLQTLVAEDFRFQAAMIRQTDCVGKLRDPEAIEYDADRMDIDFDHAMLGFSILVNRATPKPSP